MGWPTSGMRTIPFYAVFGHWRQIHLAHASKNTTNLHISVAEHRPTVDVEPGFVEHVRSDRHAAFVLIAFACRTRDNSTTVSQTNQEEVLSF